MAFQYLPHAPCNPETPQQSFVLSDTTFSAMEFQIYHAAFAKGSVWTRNQLRTSLLK